MSAIRAVLFDVGGTLVDMPEVELGARLAAALGLGAEHAATITDLVLRTGFASAYVLAERLQEQFGLADAPTEVVREIWETEREDVVEVRDAGTCVAAVAAAGAKVGVLANLSTPGLEGLRVACPEIVSRVETWTVSCEQGRAKPDATLFQAALDALGVPAAQTLMIGDRLDLDVMPALALGMSALWVRRSDAGTPPPVVTVDPQTTAPSGTGTDATILPVSSWRGRSPTCGA
jgi:putative hydrolase of the HAD superfamily